MKNPPAIGRPRRTATPFDLDGPPAVLGIQYHGFWQNRHSWTVHFVDKSAHGHPVIVDASTPAEAVNLARLALAIEAASS